MSEPLDMILWALALGLIVPSILLFLLWNTGWKPWVVSRFETRWGWWLPGGVFWKLGRRQGSLHDKWPLFFGPEAWALYRAGWEYTVQENAHEPTPGG